MYGHTKAFAKYRELSQAHLNFVVLVCHSVPALRDILAGPGNVPLHKPDYFKLNPNSRKQLDEYAALYQSELGRITIIAIFSYFESYVKDTLAEIADFHGGVVHFKTLALRRASTFVSQPPPDIEKHKRKLQDRPTKAKHEKYSKYSKLLDKSGFRFPTELLAHFGAIQMIAKIDEKRGLRAWEVPDILADCLLFPIDASGRTDFEEVRLLRNKIAHGKAAAVTLQKSLRVASNFHNLAARIDRHVLEHFFVLQQFV